MTARCKYAVEEVLEILISTRDSIPRCSLPLAICLLAVSRKPGSTATELGAILNARPSSFFEYARHLKTRTGLGLVRFRPHHDGRSNAIYLTEAGRQTVERLRIPNATRRPHP